jgi:hypothetical protein
LENPRWHGLFAANYAVQEGITVGGPKYALLIGSAGAMYDLNKMHHLYALAEYEYNEAIYKWAKNQLVEPFSGEDAYVFRASRYSVAIGDEFRFGQFGFSTTIGFYVVSGQRPPLFMYEKLGWRYYFLPTKHTQPFLNIYLKAHDITADYFSFGAGIKF